MIEKSEDQVNEGVGRLEIGLLFLYFRTDKLEKRALEQPLLLRLLFFRQRPVFRDNDFPAHNSFDPYPQHGP
jgi:hypothetical protein